MTEAKTTREALRASPSPKPARIRPELLIAVPFHPRVLPMVPRSIRGRDAAGAPTP
jgi:hypothetical protein